MIEMAEHACSCALDTIRILNLLNPRAYGSDWPSPSEFHCDMISQASQLAKISAAGARRTSVFILLT